MNSLRQSKYCPSCDSIKSGKEFGRNRSAPDGLSSYCKECRRFRDREEHHRNKLDPEWLKKERERNRNRMREKRAKPLLRAIETKKQIEREKERRKTDPGFLERIRNWRRNKYNDDDEYRARVLDRNKCWNKTDNGKACGARYDHKRRAWESSTPNDLTDEDWQKILNMQDYKCLACGGKFSDELRPERDHIIPISKGGGLTFDNVQALCRSCNVRKFNKHIDYRQQS